MKSLPTLLLAIMWIGACLAAPAQIQTAGNLLVDLDPAIAPAGPVSWITNAGTLGGVLQATGLTAQDQPLVAPIGGGRIGLVFDGHNFMEHVTHASGVQVPCPLTGNASCSIEVWVLNPTLLDFDNETMIAWGHRNEGLRNLAFGFSTQNDHGAVDRWGGNLPWTPVPSAGVWHHLVYTFDGTTTKIYADGALNNSQATGALNIAPGKPVTLAAQRNTDNTIVGWGATRGSLSLGKVRIHSGVLTAAQVANNFSFEKNLFAFAPTPLTAKPIHRYTFNQTVTNDAVELTIPDSGTPGGADAVVQGYYGSGSATLTGKKLHLLGGSSDISAYVDLPNGLLSNLSTTKGGSGQVTLEGWILVNAAVSWPHFFCFGTSSAGEVIGPGGSFSGANFVMLTQIENYRDWHRAEIANDGFNGGPATATTRDFGLENGNGTYGLTHFAMTWHEASGEVIIYQNGIASSRFVTDKKFNHIDDVNNWLGRSNWSTDSNLPADFDEFRIYDHVLTPSEVINDFQAGPDAVAVAPGPLHTVRLTLPRLSMMAQTYQQATVLADYQNVTNLNVTAASGIVYTSSDTNVIIVNATGYLTAVGPGSALITAALESKSDRATVTVTPVSATLEHRYSFNNDTRDSVGGPLWDGILQGGAAFRNNQVLLDGANGYVQLPSGIITNLEAVTVEAWASFYITEPNWCRLFDFGDQILVNGQYQGNSSFYLTPHAPGGWLHASVGNGSVGQYANRPGALDNQTNVHVVVVANPNGRSLSIYVNGVLAAVNNSLTVPMSGVKDVVNYLGKSLFDVDPLMNGAVDEFRIYGGVLALDKIAINNAAGPNKLVPDPGALQSVHLVVTNQMQVKLTHQAIFTGDFANVTGVNLFTYGTPAISSGNTNVITVTASGLLRAIAPGTTTLTASLGSLSDTQTVTVVALPPVLAHRYSFNDPPSSPKAADSIGGPTWDATLINTPLVDGQVQLDGVSGNFVQLPGNLFNNYFALSIEAWVTFGPNFAWCRLWDFGDQNEQGNGNTSLYFSPHNGGANMQMTLFDSVQGNDLIIPGVLDGQTNVHVVGVYDPYAGLISLYLNGRMAGQNNNARVLISGVNVVNAFIGRSMFNADPYLVGALEEFRIYNGALSASQVAVNYAAGASNTVSNPGSLQAVHCTVTPSMILDQVQQIQLLGDFANVTGVNLFAYGSPTATSSNPYVVTVDATGLLRAVGAGQSTLVVSYAGYHFTNAITVSLIPLTLKHRYSFNEPIVSVSALDSIGHADAALVGGASFDGVGHLVLDGINGYALLPSPLISVLTNLTLEVWVTPTSAANWQRILDFGSDNGSGIGNSYLALAAQGSPGLRFMAKAPDGPESPVLDAPIPLASGQPACVTAVYNASAGRALLYLNGVAIASGAVVTPLSLIQDVNNWLGRSQYAADPYFGASYDELRIYEGALTSAEIAAHFVAGPNAFPAPTLKASVSGNRVKISWPASAVRSKLISSPVLGPGESWSPVTAEPVNEGSQLSVTLAPTDTARFFRLSNP